MTIVMVTVNMYERRYRLHHLIPLQETPTHKPYINPSPPPLAGDVYVSLKVWLQGLVGQCWKPSPGEDYRDYKTAGGPRGRLGSE